MRLLYAAVLLAACMTPSLADDVAFDYVIVGGGPGGLQLAHYLQLSGSKYVLLEKVAKRGRSLTVLVQSGNFRLSAQDSTVASFFTRYPRWGQLISINKRYTGSTNEDFGLRHDWNSLLSDVPPHADACTSVTQDALPINNTSTAPGSVHGVACNASSSDADADLNAWRFPAYSSEYYPRAARLVDYLRCFAQPIAAATACAVPPSQRHVDRGDLNLRLGVAVLSISAGTGPWRFAVTASDGHVYSARVLVHAGGLNTLMPASNAWVASNASTYASASVDASRYVNRRLLLIGRGNAALEFAHNLIPVTAFTHVMGRPTSRIRLSWETHYTGDVRLVHALLLESYQLKSQDALFEADAKGIAFARDNATGGVTLTFAAGHECSEEERAGGDALCAEQYTYDDVIFCPGWWFNASTLFDAAVRPQLGQNQKHPAMTPWFESVNVPGLYFAGALMHGNDFRRSSGGFIHGYRYLIRALHRHLQEQEVQAGQVARLWPRTELKSVSEVIRRIVRRVNHASGIFQMFGTLMDVLVLPPVPAGAGRPHVTSDVRRALRTPEDPAVAALSAGIAGTYFEEVPIAAIPSSAARWARTRDDSASYITVSLEFGPGDVESHAEQRRNDGRANVASLYGRNAGRAAAAAATAPRRTWVRDPFSLDRVNGSVDHPEGSVFLHPVVRFWDRSVSRDAPLLVQHLVEDFHANFSDTFRHMLPLARFLVHVAEMRLMRGDAGFDAHARALGCTDRDAAAAWSCMWALHWPTSLYAHVFDALSGISATWDMMSRGALQGAMESVGLQSSARATSQLMSRGMNAQTAHALYAWWRGARYLIGMGWRNLLPMLAGSGRDRAALTAVVLYIVPTVESSVDAVAGVGTGPVPALSADASAKSAQHPGVMFIPFTPATANSGMLMSLLSECGTMTLQPSQFAAWHLRKHDDAPGAAAVTVTCSIVRDLIAL